MQKRYKNDSLAINELNSKLMLQNLLLMMITTIIEQFSNDCRK